jgi:hypothetical protein
VSEGQAFSMTEERIQHFLETVNQDSENCDLLRLSDIGRLAAIIELLFYKVKPQASFP